VNWVTGKLSGVEDSGKFWASLGRDPRTIRLEEYVSVDRAVANARDFVGRIHPAAGLEKWEIDRIGPGTTKDGGWVKYNVSGPASVWLYLTKPCPTGYEARSYRVINIVVDRKTGEVCYYDASSVEMPPNTTTVFVLRLLSGYN